MTDTGGSWRELAAVAVVLLLPIPLLAASGLRIPLPTAIERGLASLTPGGGFDAAVVEAPAARSQPAPSEPSAPQGEGTAAEAQATSSAAISPGVSDVAARSDEQRPPPTRGDAGSPAPEPGTETPPSGGGGGGGPGEAGGGTPVDAPTSAAVAGSVVEPTEDGGSALTVDVDAGGASAEVSVTENGVDVSTGGVVEAAPDVSVSPPPLSLP